jgi:hypothetical protein
VVSATPFPSGGTTTVFRPHEVFLYNLRHEKRKENIE